MKANLVKVPYKYMKNGKEFTNFNFFLVFENGAIQRIDCNRYTVERKDDKGNVLKDSNGKPIVDYKDNFDKLLLLATPFDTYNDIKF